MKKQIKKAFTLVELLVVIAILAILGTVSIVGYTSFTKKAKLSNDETLVEEWNTLLNGKEILDGKFTTSSDVRDFFIENGSTSKDFTPTSTGYYFYWHKDDNRMYLVDENTNKVIYPENSNVVNPDDQFDTNYLAFTALEDNCKVELRLVSGTIESKYEDIPWVNGFKSAQLNKGKTIRLRGTNCTTNSEKHFTITGSVAVSGSITSLTDGKGIDKNVQLTTACYNCMFHECATLTGTPELPATTLALGCYDEMFYGCTSLKTAPKLPATTLAPMCYHSMFHGCESLIKAPELPATVLDNYCYDAMFQGCTKLEEATELPAPILKEGCYHNMFTGCTTLKIGSSTNKNVANKIFTCQDAEHGYTKQSGGNYPDKYPTIGMFSPTANWSYLEDPNLVTGTTYYWYK